MSRAKIKPLLELKKIIARLKQKGKRIVFTNGCFDLLHFGHVMYLEAAKKKGDCLVVAVNSDTSVKKIKGPRRPICLELDRAGVIAGLESVDYVVIFSQETPQELIEALKPDCLVKGSDWRKKNIVGSNFIKSYGGKVARIKLAKGRSTTNLIRKIAKLH